MTEFQISREERTLYTIDYTRGEAIAMLTDLAGKTVDESISDEDLLTLFLATANNRGSVNEQIVSDTEDSYESVDVDDWAGKILVIGIDTGV